MLKKIDKIKVGDKAEIVHKITEECISKFVELTGDDNKLHTDEEFAKNTVIKKRVAHGMLGASFISTVIGTKIPGDGALWYSQSLEFLHPVRINDVITAKVEVIKKNKKHSIIELRTDIYNQNKQIVTTGIAKVKVVDIEIKEKEEIKIEDKKVALVIGGTGGIGRETCLKLASEGWNIAIHYHNNVNEALILKKEIERIGQKAIIVKCDIRNINEIKEMMTNVVRKFDTISAMVFSATKEYCNIKFELLDWDDIQEHIDINVKGSYYLAKYAAEIMEKRNYGKMIFLTSQSIESPVREYLHYITAKSALHGMVKALALELAPKGIRVNTVSPGMTDTELISDVSERTKMMSVSRTPLGRIGTPKDVAAAIYFLVSENSDFITGENIRVNGGQIMI